MKKDRQKLEDILNLILQDYSNDTKIIDRVTDKLLEKGISRGKVQGLFTQAISLSYIPQVELCLFTKHFYDATHEFKINPEEFFNELELKDAEIYQIAPEETTNRMVLHNVDQINDHQWICSKETYQNISKHFGNGLWTYNPRVQRQPMKRKVNGKIIDVININPTKVTEITKEILKGTFHTDVITLNVRKITGQEKMQYNLNNRTLTVEVDGVTTWCDIIDGVHRVGGFLKATEAKSDIQCATSIYIYYVDEEEAFQVIKQNSKQTPLDETWVNKNDVTNANMEVAKTINNRQRRNELFNRIGINVSELKREDKLVTFDTLSKTIEYIYDLNRKEVPVIQSKDVEDFLIELFNIVIGINHSAFTSNLSTSRDFSYIASNNTFIGYIALGEELKQQYPDEWQDKLQETLKQIDFTKSEDSIWKKVGLENNISLPTIKKITRYFKDLVIKEGVKNVV